MIYVDNRAGNNALNGIAPKIVSGKNGPVKTIKRALEYARPGDKIILINNDIPYHESFTLSGKRFSGIGQEMFTILGNGATISGAIPVPQGWLETSKGRTVESHSISKRIFQPVPGWKNPAGISSRNRQEPVKLTDIPAGNWAVSSRSHLLP